MIKELQLRVTLEEETDSAILLQKAVKLAPVDEPLPRYNLALSLTNLGKETEALEHCVHILSTASPEHSLWHEVKRLHATLKGETEQE